MAPRSAIARTSLAEKEERTLRRFVSLLEDRLGDRLVAVWLFGSRARGEPRHAESDVDVMVVGRKPADDRKLVHRLLIDAAAHERTNPFLFSIKVVAPEWLDERRHIESFFIQEVDRDKVVLTGKA